MFERCCGLLGAAGLFLGERYRRIKCEFVVELPLLRARWKQVLFGALFQYCHGMATQLAHRMHQPQAHPLGDLGFRFLPELGLKNAWVSESIFWSLFIPFVLWTFSPFVTVRKRFYTAVLYARLLMVLTTCQMLRIISFTVTQLPAPNYHCRLGKDTAVREMPAHWWGHLVVDVGRQSTHGCGDLIFSSHTTFVLVGVLTFTEYGSTLALKVIGWLGVAAMSLCIIASRKHYSVDVVVAWYTVPLVFYAMHRRWTTVRPVQDYWPHRPLVGEEAVEMAAVEGGFLDDNPKSEAAKPLLPLHVSHSRSGSRVQEVSHSRSGSRTQAELKSSTANGKPPLPGAPPEFAFVAVAVAAEEGARQAEDAAVGLTRKPSQHNIQQRGARAPGTVPILQGLPPSEGFDAPFKDDSSPREQPPAALLPPGGAAGKCRIT